ncbi:PREDICTED: peptidoglycan-recognition protein LC-like [Dinoponera quadriceps]|uniref:Peptidoglycan-recognition protein LC-like n=1 Tax=Dinoponera quadriceps TaxID=609295 RepID=A0A6P3Y0H1_DINQU|nr:PREDICTED: peptidoglycan-recognition protein LC-like [Dinoponera quadriceps]XP_014484297.1 PREDICTED: peptidoglycan-recognition protein LC-like [Dinoponera quadriceps]XP_014484298.1 PREDICTED: peptidoglycan-recognition protein LC-like [Dinoponera quadriceps]XP_014484299.1 PREDICTED: peptidoglycan-recognition protein LC-like [Dinoponera quadriceps]XP_014484300.1 PREDICTED: peptidoglycan-recognition protein LC-like [Dinoponera quadriceps]
MVTLVQQQQTPDDSHQYQRQEQERANGAVVSVEDHAVVFHGEEEEVARKAKETALVVPGNDSVGGSSTQCSDIDDDDVEDDEDEEETDVEEGGWVANLPAAIVQQHQAVATANGDVVLPNADPSNFGDVCVKNSSNVHLGNKTFYKGPVTIKQFVYTNPISVQDASKLEAASPASDANVSDLSANKVDVGANRPILQNNTELDKVTQWLWTWRCAALFCILALILVTAVVVSSLYLTRRASAPVFPEIPDSSVKGVTVDGVRFVQRNEWGAQPPSEQLGKLKHPVPYVIISHTATEFCTTQSECTMHVRFAQTFHIESRKWSDIGYNFLVGGDGLAYVGRSWDYVGAHAFGFNSRSIGISFIGTFNSIIPPKVQLHAAQKIIEKGIELGKIAPDYKLLGHRQVSKTLSPGDALYNILKTWPHWAPEP